MLAGLIIAGQAVVALGAIFGAVKAINKWVVRPVREFVARMEKAAGAIGTNGGSTIFEKLDGLEDRIVMVLAVFDGLEQALFLMDGKGSITSVNTAFTRMTGWPVERLRHGGWRLVLASEARDEWDDAVRFFGVFDREVVLMRLDGSFVRCHVSARPVYSGQPAKQRFIGWSGTLIKVAE